MSDGGYVSRGGKVVRHAIGRAVACLLISASLALILSLLLPSSALAYTGSGNATVGPFELPGGLTVVTWEWTPPPEVAGNFVVQLLDGSGEEVALPVNAGGYGNFGSTVVQPSRGVLPAGQYTMRVQDTTGGSWTLGIEPAGPPIEELEFTGSASRALGPFSLPGGRTVFTWTETGAGLWNMGNHFSVWLVDSNGDQVALLANELGTGSTGTIDVLPADGELEPGLYMLSVSGGDTYDVEVAGEQWTVRLDPQGPPPVTEEVPPTTGEGDVPQEELPPADNVPVESLTDSEESVFTGSGDSTAELAVLASKVLGIVGVVLGVFVLIVAAAAWFFSARAKRRGSRSSVSLAAEGPASGDLASAVSVPTCIQCGARVEPGAAVCAACGLAPPVEPSAPPASTPPEPASTPPTEVTSTCPQCGAILPQGLAVCPACGLATSGLALAASPSAAVPAPANASRGGTARVALVVVAIVALLLLACVLGWNALGLRDDRVDTPPESTSTLPPPSEPVVEVSSGPITSPEPGSAERTALMDAARLRLGIQNKFVVQGLFVQGDRAVGILNPEGTADYHLIAWTRSGEAWTATWNGTPDAAGKAAFEQAEAGLSPELIAQLGL